MSIYVSLQTLTCTDPEAMPDERHVWEVNNPLLVRYWPQSGASLAAIRCSEMRNALPLGVERLFPWGTCGPSVHEPGGK